MNVSQPVLPVSSLVKAVSLIVLSLVINIVYPYVVIALTFAPCVHGCALEIRNLQMNSVLCV